MITSLVLISQGTITDHKNLGFLNRICNNGENISLVSYLFAGPHPVNDVSSNILTVPRPFQVSLGTEKPIHYTAHGNKPVYSTSLIEQSRMDIILICFSFSY